MRVMTRLQNRLVVLGVLLVCVLVACSKPVNDEAQIRALLDAGAAALQARDATAAAKLLATSYTDSSGRSRDDLKRLAFFALQAGPVLVKVGDVSVKVDAATASATVNVLAVQGNATLKTAADLLPQNARLFSLAVAFAREDGAWRVQSINGDGAGNFGAAD